MWKPGWRLLAALAAGGVVACGGDGTGPSATELAGTWRATKAELVSVANPSAKVELIGQGATIRLVLTEAKTFTLTMSMPGQPDDVTTGTWSTTTDLLQLVYQGGSWDCEMTLSGNTLRLDGADTDYDIDGDDVDEPAKWYLTMVRES